MWSSPSTRLRTLWTELKVPTGKHRLPEIAVRRFNAAVDRPSLEDSLVDLMIVSEALFLSDQDKDRGELGYRLRQRAAKLLGASGHGWREIQAVVSRAYNLRSLVVHGADLPPSVNVDGSKLEITAFIARLSEVIRECLVVSVHEYATNKDFATTAYWDELIMGTDQATEQEVAE